MKALERRKEESSVTYENGIDFERLLMEYI